MMQVLVRADASAAIGSGHVMRCLALAQGLHAQGTRVVFACREHEGDLCALLEREGCAVLTASSWIEFNHVLAGNTPDIIFLDVNLPSIKGNRLSEVLKSQSNKKDIPIVLISDLPERSLEEMFPSSGANAWMRKPLTRDKIVDMITRYVQTAQ